MHTVRRKTKEKAFVNFAYDFTEAVNRNIESRKDVGFDKYQIHSMKGAIDGDLEAGDQYIICRDVPFLKWEYFRH